MLFECLYECREKTRLHSCYADVGFFAQVANATLPRPRCGEYDRVCHMLIDCNANHEQQTLFFERVAFPLLLGFHKSMPSAHSRAVSDNNSNRTIRAGYWETCTVWLITLKLIKRRYPHVTQCESLISRLSKLLLSRDAPHPSNCCKAPNANAYNTLKKPHKVAAFACKWFGFAFNIFLFVCVPEFVNTICIVFSFLMHALVGIFFLNMHTPTSQT